MSDENHGPSSFDVSNRMSSNVHTSAGITSSSNGLMPVGEQSLGVPFSGDVGANLTTPDLSKQVLGSVSNGIPSFTDTFAGAVDHLGAKHMDESGVFKMENAVGEYNPGSELPFSAGLSVRTQQQGG